RSHAQAAGPRNLRGIVEPAVEDGFAVIVGERVVSGRDAWVVRRKLLQILTEVNPVDGIRLDRDDLAESSFAMPEKCVDHDAVMGAAIEQDLVIAQRAHDFRDEEPVAIWNGRR